MADPIFCMLTPGMTVDRIGAASDQAGLASGTVEPADGNEGALQLRASGTPTATTAINLALVNGGIATGMSTQSDGVPGATFRWKLSTDGSTSWLGYTFPGFLRDVRVAKLADALESIPHVTPARRLPDGSVGQVRLRNAAGGNSYQFATKADRRSTWVVTSVATGISILHRPAFCVTAEGRILIAGVMSGETVARIWKSDDNGATWSVFASRTAIAVGSSGGALSMDIVRDAVLVVSGASETVSASTTKAYWSMDGGQNFNYGGAQSGVMTAALVVTTSGIPLCIGGYEASGGGNPEVVAFPIAFGGGFGSYVIIYSGALDPTNALLAATILDDGSIWTLSSGTYPGQLFDLRVSLDGGLTWTAAGGGISNAQTVIDTTQVTGGYRGIVLGSFEGSLVLTARVDTGVANQDDGLHELWLGGYDTLTETDTGGGSNGSRTQVGYYGEGGCFLPTDLPDSLGWTKTDVAAGATTTTTTDGITIVSDTTNTSLYTAPSSFWNPDSGDSARVRWKTNVTSGGSIINDVAIVQIAFADGANRQWVKIRFSSSQIRAVDNSGTIWTSALGTYTGEIEWMLSFAHDYPSAGGGQASLRYRKAADTTWTTAFEAQAIAEQAGSATKIFAFGGTSVTAACTWAIVGPWWAPGTDEIDDAWTNPDDLDGRPVTPFTDVVVTNGLSLGGSGDAGVGGDTYTLTPSYSRGARNLLLSLRPSCYAETSQDDAVATYVIGDGTMPLVGDTIALFGVNYRKATVQLNDTDSWASPALSYALDGTIYSSSVASSRYGLVTLTGASLVPHRFRSTPNRKFWISLKATNTETYEILDNDDRGIYVAGLGVGYTGEVAWIFSDRMFLRIPSASRMYLRLSIDQQITASGTYQTGTPWFGIAAPVSILYDNGFVDEWTANYQEWSTDAGLREAARRGGEAHARRIAWGAIDRMTTNYVVQLQRMLRALDGAVRPVLYAFDPADTDTLGLYTIDGPPSLENSYGEASTAYERVAQIILREYR